MSKTKGLPYEMKQYLKRHYKNDTTRKVYKQHARRFCEYVKKRGYAANEVRANPQPVLQEYANTLVANGYSAETIHTYLSFPCVFFEMPMDEINKPVRTVRDITKSRGDANIQGKREAALPENARLVKFAERVGIRRAEVTRLDGTNWKQDESGYWCVEVIKGKGGKYQLQRVLPQHVEAVRTYFDGSTDKVFKCEEMNNKIDLHAMRSGVAREAYDHYITLCADPIKRAKLEQELVDRYQMYNKRYLKSNCNSRLLAKFMAEMQGTYWLRGASKDVAIAKSRPLLYDKTALMAVSVFHLSHWRCDVTIRDYMLA